MSDLRTKVNNAVQQLASERGTTYRMLLDEDIVKHVVQTVKQRITQREGNKKIRHLASEYKKLQRASFQAQEKRQNKTPFDMFTDEQVEALVKAAKESSHPAEILEKLDPELREVVEEELFGIREEE